VLRTKLLVLVLRVDLLAFLLLDIFTHFGDLGNQVHVVCHDLQVVGFMDLTLDLQALLERVHGILKELSLVFILLLNVWIDVAVLGLLILNELVKGLVDRDLELGVVVSARDHLVDSVFEVADNGVVVANDVSVGLNLLLDEALAHAQVLHHKAERCVDAVVLFQLFVHRAGAVS